MDVSVYWPLSVLCVFVCVCLHVCLREIESEYLQKTTLSVTPKETNFQLGVAGKDGGDFFEGERGASCSFYKKKIEKGGRQIRGQGGESLYKREVRTPLPTMEYASSTIDCAFQKSHYSHLLSLLISCQPYKLAVNFPSGTFGLTL